MWGRFLRCTQTEIFLKDYELVQNYLEQVSKLFSAFEKHDGSELLSIVGWIMQAKLTKSIDKNYVIQSVQNCNKRKMNFSNRSL